MQVKPEYKHFLKRGLLRIKNSKGKSRYTGQLNLDQASLLFKSLASVNRSTDFKLL